MLQTGSLPIASREAAAAAISETFRKGLFGSTGFCGASVFFTMDFDLLFKSTLGHCALSI